MKCGPQEGPLPFEIIDTNIILLNYVVYIILKGKGSSIFVVVYLAKFSFSF